MKELIGFLYAEERKFGQRKYCVAFQESWCDPQGTIDGLAEKLAGHNAQGLMRLMPMPKECRCSNANGHTVMRPFDKEETDYLRARLNELGAKARVQPRR